MGITCAKDGFKVENESHEAPRFKQKKVSAENSKRKPGYHTGPKDHSFKVDNVKMKLLEARQSFG